MYKKRSTHRVDVLKNFAIFTGKHLQLYQKDTPTQVFSCEYCEIFKNTYLEEHLRTTDFINNVYASEKHFC